MKHIHLVAFFYISSLTSSIAHKPDTPTISEDNNNPPASISLQRLPAPDRIEQVVVSPDGFVKARALGDGATPYYLAPINFDLPTFDEDGNITGTIGDYFSDFFVRTEIEKKD